MSEIISTWSPLDIVLPNIGNDVDHAMYYVTDAGSIDGLNISFSVGDWLVYIKKDGVGNWYKTNGIVTFNTSSSANNPNPGIYTRIRLDNNGNVIAADYLEADDLPAHAHVLSDIEDKDNLIELIQETVGKMLVGSEENNSVDLVYDKNTQTISAEVNLDGVSIVKNKYGQIEIGEDYQADGTGSSSSSVNNTGTISITNVEDLTNRLTVLENLIEKNQIIINDDSGLEERDTEGGKIVKVKVDGSSIIINAFGQLEVNPDYSLDENGNLSSNCANHKHSYDQILGLEDYIVEVLSKNNTISPKDLPIDGTTIIINKDGQLAAVSTAIAQHDHVMDDIKDLNKAKADTWASDQPIKGDKTVNYTDGIIDLTSFTIGVSIEKLSEAIKSVNETAEYAKSMIGHVVPAEPNNIDYSDITYEYIDEKDVINVNSLEKVKAGDSAKVYLHDVYPYNSGDIYAYIDDKQVCKLHLTPSTTVDTVSNTDKLTTGILKVDSIYDSYKSITSFQGFYKSSTIVFTLPENIEAGIHNIKFYHVLEENNTKTSKNINLNIYKETTPIINVGIIQQVNPNFYVSGVKKLKGEAKFEAEIIVKNAYKGVFAPVKLLTSTILNDTNTYSPSRYLEDFSVSFNICINILDEYRTNNLVFNAYNFKESAPVNKYVYQVPYFIVDTTTVDEAKYRYVPFIEGKEEYVTAGPFTVKKYDPTEAVPRTELVIQNDIAAFNNFNYEKYEIGPNYEASQHLEGLYSWINFVFETDFKNNIYMDIIDKNNNSYSKIKNGTLENIQIFVSQNESLLPEYWVNGNKPYAGNGSINGINWSGLDLFRSTNTRRYITFGQRPNITTGYIFVKIGITKDSTLNCKALVDSILESINE